MVADPQTGMTGLRPRQLGAWVGVLCSLGHTSMPCGCFQMAEHSSCASFCNSPMARDAGMTQAALGYLLLLWCSELYSPLSTGHPLSGAVFQREGLGMMKREPGVQKGMLQRQNWDFDNTSSSKLEVNVYLNLFKSFIRQKASSCLGNHSANTMEALVNTGQSQVCGRHTEC